MKLKLEVKRKRLFIHNYFIRFIWILETVLFQGTEGLFMSLYVNLWGRPGPDVTVLLRRRTRSSHGVSTLAVVERTLGQSVVLGFQISLQVQSDPVSIVFYPH